MPPLNGGVSVAMVPAPLTQKPVPSCDVALRTLLPVNAVAWLMTVVVLTPAGRAASTRATMRLIPAAEATLAVPTAAL